MALVKFWGVRGSISTPGPSTVRYGGNTSCVSIEVQNNLFILDAGTGIRLLGNELMRKKQPVNANIFISHMHWDHIQGIPFFKPAFVKGNSFNIYGPKDTEKGLSKILADQMNPTYFPVELSDMGSKLTFKTLVEGQYTIAGISLECLYVNHPGNALGYKFIIDGKAIVYISDNEPFPSALNHPISSSEAVIGEDGSEKLVDFIENADILIHDAQYTWKEYQNKVTWGHSPIDYTVDIGARADVHRLVLFHHDPMHDDSTIDKLLSYAREKSMELNPSMKIYAASEGLELYI
ncbi:MAG: MBL fold metallo-hydrolase [Caldithrix sp.]|nr:MBL fold metallo-hydrolase [Caldithrix sp.]